MLSAETTTTQSESIQQLQGQGFSQEQVDLLLRYRLQYEDGTYRDEPPEHRRLEFISWLYTTGKIDG